MTDVADSDVAIVGMAGRFPGAEDPEGFWANLCQGVESIRRFTDDELRAAGATEEQLASPNYVKASPGLDDVEAFDAGLFGINPHEAEVIDPQQRLFLETVWSALENASYPPGGIAFPVGVYAGAGLSSYLFRHLWENAEVAGRVFLAGLGNENDYVATRVGYHLDLRGPCVNVQTACSTSLVAIHLACQALLAGECEMAVAGGVTVALPAVGGYYYQEGAMLSPDGHCRAFDRDAGGTVFSRGGVAAVVLKRLSDALEDGDSVVAVIKGSAVNNDGSVRAGFAAPSINGQVEVIAEALAVAGVDPETIGFVEAHGTGTAIGDPIELSALSRVFRRFTDRKGYCAIGSLKTNVGHLNRAAGVSGLIKAALAVRHGVVPPTLHFQAPNPRLGLEDSPFYVNTELVPWQRDGGPRRAAVSSFGVGGTNAHAILEQAPEPLPTDPGWPRQVLVLSARNREPLRRLAEATARRLEERPDLDLADAAYSLQVGRRPMARRLFAVAGDAAEAAGALRLAAEALPAAAEPGENPSVAFLFPGQGAQYPAMAAGLYAQEREFRRDVDEACEAVRGELGFDLREVLFPAGGGGEAAQRLEHTAVTQPALFIIEHALAHQWRRWGVEPEAMLGHSLGEYVAACLAGVFGLEDGLRLVAARGRLMESAPAGAMLSVSAPEEEVVALLDGGVELSVVNGPAACVVGGTVAAIEALQHRLEAAGVTCRRLHTSHAFHCSLMDPILEPFRERVAAVDLAPPRIPFVSNRTGTWITDEEATSADYWVDHLRNTVRFGAGIGTLLADERLVLEVGPGGVLAPLVRRHPAGRKRTVAASLPPARQPEGDLDALLAAVGTLWAAGLEPDWRGLHGDRRRRRVPLPTYPFERQRLWIERPVRDPLALQRVVKQPDIADWFYVPSWRPSLLPAILGRRVDGDEPWLLFAGEDAGSRALLAALRGGGVTPTVVRPGEALGRREDGEWTVRPGRREDLREVLASLGGEAPRRIVHLWSVDPEGDGDDQQLGFWTLLALTQVLEEMDLSAGRRITVVTRRLQPVGDEEPEGITRATLMGPCRVLPHEIPDFHLRLVDFDADGEELAALLLAEVQSGAQESFVAWRGGRRQVLGFEPVRLGREVADDELPLRQRGVYLITGGFGGLGETVAEFLAETVGARLALLGRTELPPRDQWEQQGSEASEGVRARIAQVEAIEALGAEVLPLAADVTDRASILAAVDEVRRRFGRLDGVFHSAGQASVGRSVNKTPETVADVLAPKIDGTLNLAAALEGSRPDFLILFSSVIAVVGTPGQIDYSGANAFLSVFAHRHQRRTGVRTMALDWDGWAEVGMAARLRRGRNAPSAPELHGSLDLEPVAGGPGRTAVATLSPVRHWLVAEHRVRGVPAVPGTGLLELALEAFGAGRPDQPMELEDVVFLRLLQVPDGEQRQVRVALDESAGDGAEFRIETSGQEGWEQHAIGRVRRLDGEPPRLDLEALAAVERRALPEERLRRIAAGGRLVWWGPRWSSLRAVEVGERDVVVRLELPEGFAGDLEQYRLHPALLDLATGLGSLLVEGSHLPLSYQRVRLYRPLPRRLVSHVRLKGRPRADETMITFDVTVADDSGDVVVEVEGFSMSRVVAGRAGGEAGEGEPRRNAKGILPAEGVAALRLALARAPVPQLVISTRDLHKLDAKMKATVGQATTAGRKRDGTGHPRPELTTRLVPPRTPLEEKLAEIWRTVLGLEEIGVDDDFLQLGGDSVIGIQIVSRARAAGLAVSPDLLFERPSVARLAAALEERGPQDAVVDELDDEPETAASYPLTPLQREMVEHPGAAAGSRVYRLQVVLRFDSGVSPQWMTRAWNQVAAQQPILRTAFPAGVDGVREQVVSPPEPVEVPFHDWSEVAPGGLEGRWQALLEEDRSVGIDPARPPLVRPVLVRLGNGEDRLLVTAHHAVMDGWSIGTLLHRLGQALTGEPLSPALPFRRVVEAKAVVAGHPEYWRQQLAGSAGGGRLPESLRAGAGSGEGHGWWIEQADAEAAQALARRAEVSVATVVLGAWGLALAEEGGAAPVLGVVVSGRTLPLPDVDAAVGLFINRLPLHVPLSDAPLTEWLHGLEARQRRLQQHEHTPLERVEEWCGGGPLFETLIRFQNFPLDRLQAVPGLRGLDWEDVWPYPLDLEVRPQDGMALRLNYDRARVGGPAARALLERVRDLVSAMAAGPETIVSRLIGSPVEGLGRAS